MPVANFMQCASFEAFNKKEGIKWERTSLVQWICMIQLSTYLCNDSLNIPLYSTIWSLQEERFRQKGGKKQLRWGNNKLSTEHVYAVAS